MLLLCLLLVRLSVALYPTELIYQAPNNTWLENLVIRPDGSILTTLLTTPNLYLIQPDPQNPDPKLIYSFTNHTGLLGIASTSPTTYFVAATNFSLSTVSGAPGSSAIYQVTLPQHPHHPNTTPKVSLTTLLPNTTGLPNGLLALNNHTLLLADSNRGNILSISTLTGATHFAITDPLLLPTTTNPIGVNGLKVLRLHNSSTLYFTNSGQRTLCRIPISPTNGSALAPATIVARGQAPPEVPASVAYDDFALSEDGKFAYVATTGGNTVDEVDVERGTRRTVAGNLNSTEIAQPTAMAFGGGKRGEGRLFVVTAGAIAAPVNGDEIVGGQVVAVDVGR